MWFEVTIQFIPRVHLMRWNIIVVHTYLLFSEAIENTFVIDHSCKAYAIEMVHNMAIEQRGVDICKLWLQILKITIWVMFVLMLCSIYLNMYISFKLKHSSPLLWFYRCVCLWDEISLPADVNLLVHATCNAIFNL